MAERLKLEVVFEGDRARSKVKKFNRELDKTEKTGAKTQSRMQKMSGALNKFTTVTTASTAALLTFKKGFDLAEQGAQTLRLASAGDTLAMSFGTNMDAIVRSIQEASGFTISRMDAMAAANKAMQLGVADTPEEFADLTRSGVALGRAMGRDAAQSIDDITTGIGRMSPLILDNIGITTEGGAVYERYAESIGKAAGTLTDAEKKQALLNAAVESSQPLLSETGGLVEDEAAAFERLNAQLTDTTTESKEWLATGLVPWLTTIPEATSEIFRINRAWRRATFAGADFHQEMNIGRQSHFNYIEAERGTAQATRDVAAATETATRKLSEFSKAQIASALQQQAFQAATDPESAGGAIITEQELGPLQDAFELTGQTAGETREIQRWWNAAESGAEGTVQQMSSLDGKEIDMTLKLSVTGPGAQFVPGISGGAGSSGAGTAETPRNFGEQHGGWLRVPGRGMGDRNFRIALEPGELLNVIPRQEVHQTLNQTNNIQNGVDADSLVDSIGRAFRRA